MQVKNKNYRLDMCLQMRKGVFLRKFTDFKPRKNASSLFHCLGFRNNRILILLS